MAVFDVIKFDGARNNETWLVYKSKKENIAWGSQLIVGMGQEAIFIKGGRAQDIFTPGTYTLKSGNLPLLGNLVGRAFGGNTPFTAEVVFVNRTNNFNLKWGTRSSLNMEDPKKHLILSLCAHGSFSVKINNTRDFINQFVGTLQLNSGFNDDIVWNKYNPLINTVFQSQLLQFMTQKNLSFLEIAAYYKEISENIFKELKKDFEGYGLDLVNFLVEDVSPPLDDYEVVKNGQKARAFGESDYNRKQAIKLAEKFNDPTMGRIIVERLLGSSTNDSSVSSMQNSNTNTSQSTPPGSNTSDEINCPYCNGVVKAGKKFCRHCGKPLPREKFCSHCGERLEIDARFCDACGEACE